MTPRASKETIDGLLGCPLCGVLPELQSSETDGGYGPDIMRLYHKHVHIVMTTEYFSTVDRRDGKPKNWKVELRGAWNNSCRKE